MRDRGASNQREAANRLRKTKGGQRVLALLIAVAVHVAFYVLFIIPTGKAIAPPPQGGEQGVVTVALIAGAAPPDPAPGMSELNALRSRLLAQAPSPLGAAQPSPPKDVAALLRLFDPVSPPSPNHAAAPRPAGAAKGRGAQIIDPMSLASIPSVLQANASPSPLWPQVARCWRAPGGSVRVVMVVHLDANGEILGSPIILRSIGGATPEVVAAEQEATRALWACAPYRTLTTGSSAFDLLFKADGSG